MTMDEGINPTYVSLACWQCCLCLENNASHTLRSYSELAIEAPALTLGIIWATWFANVSASFKTYNKAMSDPLVNWCSEPTVKWSLNHPALCWTEAPEVSGKATLCGKCVIYGRTNKAREKEGNGPSAETFPLSVKAPRGIFLKPSPSVLHWFLSLNNKMKSTSKMFSTKPADRKNRGSWPLQRMGLHFKGSTELLRCRELGRGKKVAYTFKKIKWKTRMRNKSKFKSITKTTWGQNKKLSGY